MRIGDPLTLVVPQCHHSCLKKVPRVLRNDLNCLNLEFFRVLSSASTSNTSAGAEPDDASVGADDEAASAG